MSKLKEFPGNAYRVFQDAQRHTCLRVNVSPQGVHYIPWDVTTLEVKFLSNKEFEQTFVMESSDYPVKKAAQSYLSGTWMTVSPEAKKHLIHLTGGKYKETAKPLNFDNKESIMTEAAAAEATAKKTKGKVAAPKADTKAAPKGKTKVVAEKAAPKGKTKVAAPAAEKATRTSKEAGLKIKVIDKNPSVRPGSNREAQFNCILSSKTTDEAAEKLRELTNKPWDVIRVAVANGIIEIG